MHAQGAYHSMLGGRSQQALRSRAASFFATCSLPLQPASACLCIVVGHGAEYRGAQRITVSASRHALTVREY